MVEFEQLYLSCKLIMGCKERFCSGSYCSLKLIIHLNVAFIRKNIMFQCYVHIRKLFLDF